MKKRLLTLTLAAIMLLCTVFSFTACDVQDNGKIKIGICQLIEHGSLDAATQGFIDCLTEKLGEENVEFDVQLAQGEQSNCSTICNKFVTNNVDLIMANATNAVKAAKEATSSIPIIGTSVTDYVSAGLIESNDAPGSNITGVSDLNPVTTQIELVRTLCPNAKTIGIVYCSAEENSKVQAQEAKTAFEAEGYEVKTYTVADTNEINTVVQKACSEVDAFYEPTDNLIAANVPAMSNVTTPAGKPVITAVEDMAKDGFLATYSINYYDIGVKAGEMAYDILINNSNPATMPIYHFTTDTLNLVINNDTAEALGIKIPDALQK